MTVVPYYAFLGFVFVSSDHDPLLCTPATCRWGAGGICLGWPVGSLLLGLGGRGFSNWPRLAAVRSLPLDRACLFPSYGEGYSEGPLVTLFILKLVNEMSQLLSAGGRQLSSSWGCVSSTRVHW